MGLPEPTYEIALSPLGNYRKDYQQYIMQSGGIYQLGDISVGLNEELEEVTDKTRGVGDRMVWRGNEYRIAGKKKNQAINDRDHIFSYVMRKVD